MPRLRNHYIRGTRIQAPRFGGMDISASIVAQARIVRESLDSGLLGDGDVHFLIENTPEDSRLALIEALEALGIKNY